MFPIDCFLGLYDIEGKLADLAKLFGKGSFDIMLRDINAAGHVKLWLKGLSTLEISEFNLVPSIGSMKVGQAYSQIRSFCYLPRKCLNKTFDSHILLIIFTGIIKFSRCNVYNYIQLFILITFFSSMWKD